MELGEYIRGKIERKGLTKDMIYKPLGMARGTLYNRLEDSKFTVDEFIQLCKLLNINPNEWFNVQGFVQSEVTTSLVNEPEESYSYAKKSVNQKLKIENTESDTVKELLKQNSELISIIKNLTKSND